MFDREEDIFHLLKVIHLQTETGMNGVLAHYGVTAAQADILRYIIRYSDTCMTSTDVHRQMCMSRANVSGILKKLRSRDFLEFEKNPADDRQKRILVTQKALEFDRETEKQYLKIRKKIFKSFSEEEMGQLETLLTRLFLNLKAENMVGQSRQFIAAEAMRREGEKI